jgi:hypothetical protein
MRLPSFTAERSLGLGTAAPAPGVRNWTWGSAEEVCPAQLPCIWGNWCGPGCSGPAGPVDDLDACCQAHDNCYDARGYLACSCDRELMDCAWSKINPFTAKGRAAAAVWWWFAHGWCNPFA